MPAPGGRKTMGMSPVSENSFKPYIKGFHLTYRVRLGPTPHRRPSGFHAATHGHCLLWTPRTSQICRSEQNRSHAFWILNIAGPGSPSPTGKTISRAAVESSQATVYPSQRVRAPQRYGQTRCNKGRGTICEHQDSGW